MTVISRDENIQDAVPLGVDESADSAQIPVWEGKLDQDYKCL